MPRLRHYCRMKFTCSKIPCLEIPVCLWAKIGIFLRKIISVTKQEVVACDVVAEYPSYCMIYCRRSSRKVVIMSYNISNLILTGCRTIIWIFRFFLKDQEKVFLSSSFLHLISKMIFDFFSFYEFLHQT